MSNGGKIIIPAGCNPWPHEMRAAEIIAKAGYCIEFIEESNIYTADILINGIEFELKSPRSAKANSIEHLLKKTLKQSPNIIIDTSRIKYIHDKGIQNFLISQLNSRRRIKIMGIITKNRELIWLTKIPFLIK